MIGSLNGVENVVNALTAGVTSIGNLAQYFTYEYPGLEMEAYRTEDYIKAMAIMGEFKDDGVCMHCNLDDGYGALFHDVANLLGWAMLEKYVAEDLIGGNLAHCYGNLFSDSFLRIVFNRALSMINKNGTPGTFVNGNTIDYGTSLPRNYGVLCAYALPDVACQLTYPSGYAVAPVPFTEAVRIPEPQEIIDAHLTLDMVIEKAPYYARYIDWDKVNADAEILVTGGNVFFERVMNALDDMGVDLKHAGEIAAVLKAIGPAQLEEAFGSGKRDKNAMRGRIPVKPTSIVQTTTKIEDDAIAKQSFAAGNGPLAGITAVVDSTDVHEFGKEVIRNYLRKAGAQVFDLGTSVAISEIVDNLIETGSKVLCMSTYNGMAYSFARDLLKALKENGLEDTHVLMGGRLNEAMDGSDVPIDVTDKLTAMGINTDNDIDTIAQVIASYFDRPQGTVSASDLKNKKEKNDHRYRRLEKKARKNENRKYFYETCRSDLFRAAHLCAVGQRISGYQNRIRTHEHHNGRQQDLVRRLSLHAGRCFILVYDQPHRETSGCHSKKLRSGDLPAGLAADYDPVHLLLYRPVLHDRR